MLIYDLSDGSRLAILDAHMLAAKPVRRVGLTTETSTQPSAVQAQTIRCWPWRPFYGAAELGGGPLDCRVFQTEYRLGAAEFFCDVGGKKIHSHDGTGIVIAGQWEVHSRENLVRALGLYSADFSDEKLIKEGFRRWGIDLAGHLDGQFSFVVWDRATRCLVAFRDHLGSLPFLYRWNAGAFCFAGDMKTMLRQISGPRKLKAEALVSLAFRSNPENAKDTFHDGVFSLPPGSCLSVNSKGIRVTRYWAPSINPSLLPRSEEEVFSQARALLASSVANRIGGRRKVAVLVSGGLDSSALAATAARYLGRTGGSLIGLASINDPAHKQVADEKPWVEKLRAIDNLEIRYIESPGAGPMDGIEDIEAFETSPRINMPYFYNPMIAAASREGAALLLTGNFGEMTSSARPVPLFLDLLRQGDGGELLRELDAVRRFSGKSRLRHFGSDVFRWLMSGRRAASSLFLSRDFCQAMSLPPLWLPPSSWDSSVNLLQQTEAILARDALRSVLPPDHLLSLCQPYLDRKLLEFCLAVPGRCKQRNGYSRYLLRKAFADMLPADITWRRGKMWATPDYYQRFNRQIAKGADFIRTIGKSDPVRALVDVNLLEKAIRPVESRPAKERHHEVFIKVPATLQLICFLRQFAEFRA